jgi:hypothetical protein
VLKRGMLWLDGLAASAARSHSKGAETMKKLVVAWVAGFVFAMALVVRWQRIGNAAVQPASETLPEPAPATEAKAPGPAQPGGVLGFASAGWDSVRVGARKDLGALRQAVGRVRPDRAPDLAVDNGMPTVDLRAEGLSAAAG